MCRMMFNKCELNCSVFLILIVFGLLETVFCVRINRLNVPEVAHLGNPVVLDCDYTLEGSLGEGLVVKWFFNEKPTPVYQWIPNKKPQETGILKGKVNLSYSASKDKNSVHRAIQIIKLDPDLSGNYTCMVSTFNGEDRKTKGMLILVPGKNLEFRQEYIGNQMSQLMCYAEGVFPKPNMSLHIGNSEVNNSEVFVYERNGLFDIKAMAEIPSLEAPEEFSCALHIPQANYTVKKQAIYYPASGGSTNFKISFLLGCVLVTFFHLPLCFG